MLKTYISPLIVIQIVIIGHWFQWKEGIITSVCQLCGCRTWGFYLIIRHISKNNLYCDSKYTRNLESGLSNYHYKLNIYLKISMMLYISIILVKIEQCIYFKIYMYTTKLIINRIGYVAVINLSSKNPEIKNKFTTEICLGIHFAFV